MKEYVLGFVFDERLEKVLLIERKKEPYQYLLNGIGGKVEKGEVANEAMEREWKEETGLHESPSFHYLNSLIFKNGIVLHVYYGVLMDSSVIPTPIDSGEGEINWHHIYEESLLQSEHPLLAENVPTFLEMAIEAEEKINKKWLVRLKEELNEDMKKQLKELNIPIVYQSDIIPLIFVRCAEKEILEKLPFVEKVSENRTGKLWV